MASPTGAVCLSTARTLAQDVDDESANLGLSNAQWLLLLNEAQREVWAANRQVRYVADLVGDMSGSTAKMRYAVTLDGLAEIERLEFNASSAGLVPGTVIPMVSIGNIVSAYETAPGNDTAPTMAAVVAREGSDPDMPFEIVVYPPITLVATTRYLGGWVRKHPTAIANDSTQVDLQPDEADFFIRMAAVRGAQLLGHDMEFVRGLEAPLPEQFRKFTEKQARKIVPRAGQEIV